MKKLLNVLYVTTPETYLTLDGENVVVKREDGTSLRLPLHNLEAIVCCSYTGASPALMGACAERQIGLSFLRPSGRFLARVTGSVNGNVLLRRKQYRLADDPQECLKLSNWFLSGKIFNSKKVIDRALRDHAMAVDAEKLRCASESLRGNLKALSACSSNSELMGFEGSAAREYFGVLDELILQQKNEFYFRERSRRPPQDAFNALLSFLYILLSNACASALEAVGLDPYVGFLHRDRPGRPSLALDLMEELRPIFADRLALSMVNRRQISGKGFIQKESGGIIMDDETRKKVIQLWQERKKEELEHPFLKERIEFGLIPHVQAMLLARYLRGDLDAYPPFFWA